MAAVESRTDHTGGEQNEAKTLAALLSESVKISISLSQAMNIKTDDGDDDAIRVALAALSGGILADTYRQTGRLPGDNDVRRISKALESVIVFADNFTPAAEHANRLETLEGPPPFFDAVQTNIFSVHALLPVIAAVCEFSFGQQDARLIQDIAERLGARAKDFRARLTPDGTAMAEMVILQALAQIYAAAHRAETTRAQQTGDAQVQPSMDSVWSAFDRQSAMVEVLMGAMAGVAVEASDTSAVKPEPAVSPAEVVAPVTQAAPELEAEAPPAGASPMTFFKKK